MPQFLYKEQYRDAELDETLGGSSLYGLIHDKLKAKVYDKVDTIYANYVTNRAQHTLKENGVEYLSVLELFNNLLNDKDASLDDANVASEIYKADKEGAKAITGKDDANSYLADMNKCIDAAAKAFTANLGQLQDSFRTTYRHKDISGLLGVTKVVTKPGLVKSRVFETAYILDKIVDRGRFMTSCLLLGIMHIRRFPQTAHNSNRTYYNQGSALFTLMTFAYTPVKHDMECMQYWKQQADERKNKESEEYKRDKKEEKAFADGLKVTNKDEVYRFWKLFGSFLGIHTVLLPDNYEESRQIWNQFENKHYDRVVTLESLENDSMIKVFNESIDPNPILSNLDFATFGLSLNVSSLAKSMPNMVSSVARWIGSVASSDHAGQTCCKCKTAHGKTISLVRFWHRCSDCKKVYCPACAGRLNPYSKLAAFMAGATGSEVNMTRTCECGKETALMS